MTPLGKTLLKLIIGLIVAAVIIKASSVAISWNAPINQFKRSIVVEHEHRSSDEFGDGVILIVGKLDETPMGELAEILDLPKHTRGRLRDSDPEAPGWQNFREHSWWKLPKSFDEIYYHHESGSQWLLGRSGENLYLMGINW